MESVSALNRQSVDQQAGWWAKHWSVNWGSGKRLEPMWSSKDTAVALAETVKPMAAMNAFLQAWSLQLDGTVDQSLGLKATAPVAGSRCLERQLLRERTIWLMRKRRLSKYGNHFRRQA